MKLLLRLRELLRDALTEVTCSRTEAWRALWGLPFTPAPHCANVDVRSLPPGMVWTEGESR